MQRPLAWTLASVIAIGSSFGCSSDELPTAPASPTPPGAPKDASTTAKPGPKTTRTVGNSL